MSKLSTERRQAKSRGYEDCDMLQILAQVMIENPEWSVAAAIKSIGITDTPSIRRLRDKHQVETQRRELLAAAIDNGQVIPFPAAVAVQAASVDAPEAVVVEPAPVAPVPVQAAVAATADKPETRKMMRDEVIAASMPAAPFSASVMLPEAYFASFSGAGMQAWMSLFELQQLMVVEVMKTLPMAAVLHGQVLMTELTMTACKAHMRPRKLKE